VDLKTSIIESLPEAMVLPDAFAKLFDWMSTQGLVEETSHGLMGFLSPSHLWSAGKNDESAADPEAVEAEEPPYRQAGGTEIVFVADPTFSKYWFSKKADRKAVDARLVSIARSGGEGSVVGLWLDDQGDQHVVHMGSGSGSAMVCILTSQPSEFLRLLAVGYDEICWGGFHKSPAENEEIIVEPNVAYREWVIETFDGEIPETGAEIVKSEAGMDDSDAVDPFLIWVNAMNIE
jgi:hypothetical protein